MSRRLMNDDLKRSGISEGIGKKLEMELLTAKETKTLGHFEVPSYRIPYFDVRGKPTNYYRVRYLEIPTGEFGRELPKEARYSGPPAKPSHGPACHPDLRRCDDTENLPEPVRSRTIPYLAAHRDRHFH